MFFMFLIFLLINYVSDSNNFVLKSMQKYNNQNCTNNREQDVHNISFGCTSPKPLHKVGDNLRSVRNPNLKVNLIDKTLSDEMLSLKQNLYENDLIHSSTKFKSTVSPIITPTLELNQKWPIGELIKQIENEENRYDSEDFDFAHLFPENIGKKVSTTKDLKSESINHAGKEQNDGKVVDLRSLSHQFRLPDIHVLGQSVTEHNCNCSRSKSYSYVTEDPFSQKGNVVTGTTMSFPFLPFYLPYQPNLYYPPNVFMEPELPIFYISDTNIGEDDDNDDEKGNKFRNYENEKDNKFHSDDENDDDDRNNKYLRHEESNSDDESNSDIENHKHSEKSKKKKKPHKCKDHHEKLIKIDYDLKPITDTNPQNPAVEENKSKELLTDLISGLSRDFKIQSCRSLFGNCNSCVLARTLLFLMFVIDSINYIQFYM